MFSLQKQNDRRRRFIFRVWRRKKYSIKHLMERNSEGALLDLPVVFISVMDLSGAFSFTRSFVLVAYK